MLPTINQNGMIASTAIQPTVPSLGLTQIEGFEPVKGFIDDSNTEWTLLKSSSDPTISVPDFKNVQVTDFWNHEYSPNGKVKVYIYVVEGICQPRVETEQPVMVLFQWFSATGVMTFTPQMISANEWAKANVYRAKVKNQRMSKFMALCRINNAPAQEPQKTDTALLQVEGISGVDSKRDTE